MIIQLLLWFLSITLTGWLIFPPLYHILRFLPDRGLAFIKPAGLLLWAYLFWILTTFNVLQNNFGGVLFALALVGGLSLWAWRRSAPGELFDWLRTRRRQVLIAEVVFLLAFLLMALLRAASPEASGTEKPMELAFINAILKSDAFPPHDPWLSGYAISYYYFGYIMVAMLARFTGTTGAVAFNIGLSAWFGLTAVAAYGVLFNLLGLRAMRQKTINWGRMAGSALLGPFFLLIVSNLEGFLEIIHARGWFWQTAADGSLVSPFWKGLAILELVNPPTQPFNWAPTRSGGIWWWRASRVLQDFDMAHASREIIDEFPFFSYYLGDLHPHVLSIPFVLLTVALALNLYLRERCAAPDRFAPKHWFRRPDTWAAVISLGALAFLNTWDFPIYLALFAAAYALAHFERGELLQNWLVDTALMAGMTAVAGVVLYLPFYLGFQSQAGGLLPSLVYFTRGTYFWIMFGGLLLPIFVWLLRSARTSPFHGRAGILFALAIMGGLWGLMSLYGMLVAQNPALAGIFGADVGMPLVLEAFLRRLAAPGAWLTLALGVALVMGLLAKRGAEDEPAHGFGLLLILIGLGLTIFPEFFYLRDQFGWRMNTIFKFYYQAWVVWALTAAYASVVLLDSLRKSMRYIFAVTWVIVLAMGLIYPLYSISRRMDITQVSAWTLDGSAYLSRYQPDDMAAVAWLRDAPTGVLAEAVGGSYTGYARASTFSGQPGVLGWPGHESQWRGGAEEIGSRETDLEQLFRATRPEQAQPIIDRYHIRYLFVGSLEREKYRVNEAFFNQNFFVAYQSGQTTIYETTLTLSPQQAVQP